MNPIHIIVGSQMGAAEFVAEELAGELESLGHQSHIHEAPEYDQLPQKTAYWLIVTSTHGAGDLPDNIQPFFDALTQNNPDLSQLKYAVIGLGDKSYDTYCAAAHKIDQLLRSLNAQSSSELFEINALDELLPEEYALQWLPRWLNAL